MPNYANLNILSVGYWIGVLLLPNLDFVLFWNYSRHKILLCTYVVALFYFFDKYILVGGVVRYDCNTFTRRLLLFCIIIIDIWLIHILFCDCIFCLMEDSITTSPCYNVFHRINNEMQLIMVYFGHFVTYLDLSYLYHATMINIAVITNYDRSAALFSYIFCTYDDEFI
jgi:hypothetical protein